MGILHQVQSRSGSEETESGLEGGMVVGMRGILPDGTSARQPCARLRLMKFFTRPVQLKKIML